MNESEVLEQQKLELQNFLKEVSMHFKAQNL